MDTTGTIPVAARPRGTVGPPPGTADEATDTRPWRLRYTWRPGPGVIHPEFTYSEFDSETRAIDAAVALKDSQKPTSDLLLVDAHVRHGDAPWRRIE